MSLKDILKKRRLYAQESSNNEIKQKKSSGKMVSRKEQREIYEKYKKEALRKFPLKK